MASTLKHLRSSTADKRPTASGLVDGQLAINTASGTPALFFKDSNGGVVKVGPAHVGSTAPNAVPAGSAGNSLGELWVDNSLTTPGLNYYTGSAFVNLTPSGTTTTVGLVELATPAETQTGTDAARAVTPSGLQSKVSDSTSTTSSTTIASSTAVKSAYDLANAALPKTGGTITGELLIGTTGSLVFEGATDNTFETTIAVVDPTADRTITFPNITGTVVTTGDTGTVTSTMIANDTIVNADINSAAAIAGTKISPDFGSQNIVTTGTNTAASFIPTSSGVPTNGLYLSGTNSIGIATNSTPRLDIASTGQLRLSNGGGLSVSIDGSARTNSFTADANGSIGIGAAPAGVGVTSVVSNTGPGIYVGPNNPNYLGLVYGNTHIGDEHTFLSYSSGYYYLKMMVSGPNAVPEVVVNDNGANLDFRVEGDTNANLFFVDASTDRVGINDSTPDALLTVNGVASFGAGAVGAPSVAARGDLDTGIYFPGTNQLAITTNGVERVKWNTTEVVFNDGGENYDFRIESVSDQTLFYVDASRDAIGIGTSTPSNVNLLDVFSNTKSELIRLASNNGYTGVQQTFLYNNTVIGGIGSSKYWDPTLSLSDLGVAATSNLDFVVNQASRARLSTTEAVFNETGANYDFRIEGDTNANLFFVDASTDRVGIGTSSPQATFHIKTGTDSNLRFSYAAGGINLSSMNDSSSAYGAFTAFASPFRFNSYLSASYSSVIFDYGESTFNVTNENCDFRIKGQTNSNLFFVDASTDRVGIGTTSPQELLDVYGTGNTTLRISGSSGGGGDVSQIDFFRIGSNVTSSIKAIRDAGNTSGALTFLTASSGTNSEKARIDSSGRLLVGTSTARANFFQTTDSGQLQVEGTGFASITRNSNDALPGALILAKSRGSTNTILQNKDLISQISFQGNDGSQFVEAARIDSQVDAVPGLNKMPGNLAFYTATNAATSQLTERMRIDSSGRLLAGTSTARDNISIQYTSAVGGVNFGRTDVSPGFQIENAGSNNGIGRYLSVVQGRSSALGPVIILGKTRSDTLGQNTVVVDGDAIGTVSFLGADGTRLVEGASIRGEVDGTPGANDMPGRLLFSVTGDGASSPTEAMRINNQRELLIGTTTRTANGGVLQISNGITFPGTQSACSDANTLDDYEEGTWTPALNFGGATTGITYNARQGYYVKIGKIVFITVYFNLSSKGTATGAATITGLPYTSEDFTISGTTSWPGSIPSRRQNQTATNFAMAVQDNTTTIAVTDGAGSNLTDTTFTNGTIIECALSYRTA